MQPGLSPRDIVEQSSCFTADTVIHTLSGDFTVTQLLERGEDEFEVFSTDGEFLRVGRAFNLRKTKISAKVYKVLFDTGEELKLTEDHLVMMRDGSYKEVRHLCHHDSVMPFNYSYRKRDGDDRRRRFICPKISGKKEAAHIWVYSQTHTDAQRGRKFHVHHKDEDVTNNASKNLEQLSDVEHATRHALQCPPMHKPGAAEKMSKLMMGNKHGVGPKPGTAKAMMGNKHAQKPPHPDPKVQQQRDRVREYQRRKREKSGSYNHKVISVEFAGREDVYDLSVHEYHNFAANGVFIHNCFVFHKGKVITYNDEVSCRKESPLPPEFAGAVAAKPLTTLLGKMQEDEVSVEQKDGHLVIHGKRRRGGVRMEQEILLPIKNVERPGEWKPLHENFSDAVSMVEQSAGKDESRFALTCLNITSTHIEACDDLQITRYTIDTPVDKPFLVRRDSLKHITSLDMTEFSETEAWVHFRNPAGLILSCRRWIDEYPDMSEYLQVDGEPMTLPKGLVEAVEKAQIFSSENQDENQVTVELRQGELKLVGEGVSGWYKERKKVKYNGQDMMFRISPKLLAELVTRHNECVVTDNRLKVDGGKWVYVTCLGQPTVETDEPEVVEDTPAEEE